MDRTRALVANLNLQLPQLRGDSIAQRKRSFFSPICYGFDSCIWLQVKSKSKPKILLWEPAIPICSVSAHLDKEPKKLSQLKFFTFTLHINLGLTQGAQSNIFFWKIWSVAPFWGKCLMTHNWEKEIRIEKEANPTPCGMWTHDILITNVLSTTKTTGPWSLNVKSSRKASVLLWDNYGLSIRIPL